MGGLERRLGLKRYYNKVETLGIIVTGNELDHYHYNFKPRIQKIKNILNMWQGRNLSLKGRITIINSLIIPKILYPASMIYTSKETIKELKTVITNFIWKNKTAKIAYNTLIQPIEEGGLRLIDVGAKTVALQLSWIPRLIKNDNLNWAKIIRNIMGIKKTDDFFYENRSPIKTYSLFYNDIHREWVNIINPKSPDKKMIKNERLWNNQFIRINNEYINWANWKSAGIFLIQDLIHENGDFLRLEEINKKFNLNLNILNLTSIIKAIPQSWKDILKGDNRYVEWEISTAVCKLKELNFKSLEIYKLLVKMNIKPLKCIKKWEEDFPKFTEVTVDLWPNIFKNAFICCRETKLQSLQYNLIHRNICCQDKLYEWTITQTAKCKYCERRDTIIHFFLQCEKVNNLWFNIIKWWNNLNLIKIDHYSDDLSECLLFGFPIRDLIFDTLNMICLQVKWFIYTNKIEDNNINISMVSFLPKLKWKLTIEKQILIKEEDNDKSLEVIEIIEQAL
jgi:hypothetical protein